MSSFQPGFLNTGAQRPVPRDRRGALRRFWDEQIVSPEKVDGNLSVAWAVSLFAGGILIARTLARDVIVPAF